MKLILILLIFVLLLNDRYEHIEEDIPDEVLNEASNYAIEKLCKMKGYGYKDGTCVHKTKESCLRENPGEIGEVDQEKLEKVQKKAKAMSCKALEVRKEKSIVKINVGEWAGGKCIAGDQNFKKWCLDQGMSYRPDISGVGKCKTNSKYCKRMGVYYKSGDCYRDPLQWGLEWILGTTVTRALRAPILSVVSNGMIAGEKLGKPLVRIADDIIKDISKIDVNVDPTAMKVIINSTVKEYSKLKTAQGFKNIGEIRNVKDVVGVTTNLVKGVGQTVSDFLKANRKAMSKKVFNDLEDRLENTVNLKNIKNITSFKNVDDFAVKYAEGIEEILKDFGEGIAEDLGCGKVNCDVDEYCASFGICKKKKRVGGTCEVLRGDKQCMCKSKCKFINITGNIYSQVGYCSAGKDGKTQPSSTNPGHYIPLGKVGCSSKFPCPPGYYCASSPSFEPCRKVKKPGQQCYLVGDNQRCKGKSKCRLGSLGAVCTAGRDGKNVPSKSNPGQYCALNHKGCSIVLPCPPGYTCCSSVLGCRKDCSKAILGGIEDVGKDIEKTGEKIGKALGF